MSFDSLSLLTGCSAINPGGHERFEIVAGGHLSVIRHPFSGIR
jgi:hypothetical protein